MVFIDRNNYDDMKKIVSRNTKIDNIIYINEYDNYYIIKNNDYVYVIDKEYNKIFDINIDKLCDKDNDLIYSDNNLLYVDSYSNKEGVIFKYYDVYTCKLINEVMVGGSYG